jgi:hypothetical protein
MMAANVKWIGAVVCGAIVVAAGVRLDASCLNDECTKSSIFKVGSVCKVYGLTTAKKTRGSSGGGTLVNTSTVTTEEVAANGCTMCDCEPGMILPDVRCSGFDGTLGSSVNITVKDCQTGGG